MTPIAKAQREREKAEVSAFDAAVKTGKLRLELAKARKTLTALVLAWEKLPGGKQQPVLDVERWLIEDMKPAIDVARAYLDAVTKRRA